MTADVLRLQTQSGAAVTTTVTATGENITFDASGTYDDGWKCVCVNLTEDETRALIRNLVASLNAYQRAATAPLSRHRPLVSLSEIDGNSVDR